MVDNRASLPADLQRLLVPKSSEHPAFRRDHWAVGRPSLRIKFLPLSQPSGESSHASCRPSPPPADGYGSEKFDASHRLDWRLQANALVRISPYNALLVSNRSVNTSRLSMSRSLVSRFVLCFFLHRAFALVVALASLLSTVFLFALWMSCLEASSVPVGVREESRCCHLSVGLEGRSRLAVIGTRCRRNG
jgi:hypothetical protein